MFHTKTHKSGPKKLESHQNIYSLFTKGLVFTYKQNFKK